MILQIGAFLQGIGEFGRDLFGATRPAITGVLGGAEPGFFSGLGGFLKETGGQLTSAILRPAIQVGEGLLRRELARPILRKQKSELRAQARIQSNLLGQGPAVLGQTAVATGGRVFQPPLLVTNVVPPSPAPPQLRPVGLKAGPADRIASLALKNLAGKGVATAAARRAAGFAFGPLGGAAAAASTLIPGNGARPFETVFPRGPSRLFLPGTRGVPTMPNGIMTRGRSIFQRNAEGGVQHYVLDNDCLQPIEVVANTEGKSRFRLDLTDGKFKKIKPRRMNPLNFKALGRARRRTGSALRICRTMFTEARREKTGRVRPKRRKKK